MKNIFFKSYSQKAMSIVGLFSLMSGGVVYASGIKGTEIPIAVCSNVAQQQTKVTGVVYDGNGDAVIGATVKVKGTSIGVITDFEGKFELNVSNKNAVLEVSFIGFKSQEVILKNRKHVVVNLSEDVQNLEEVTVVAYGVQKKATLTGAISSVGSDALLKSPSASIANSLAGQLPGVSSMQTSGQPGADDAKIFVRGVGSLTEAGASPLILVDGVERSFFQMDPNEIESINILKDASATAVFGVRGANGVILVTTKRGEEGNAKISVSSNVGIQMPTRMLKLADSYTWATCYNEAQTYDGVPKDKLAFNDYSLERFRTGDSPILYPSIDWYDYLTDKTAIQTQHNVNVSGGTKDIRYFVSLGFLYQDGFMKQLDGLEYNNDYSYTRYNYRANLDVNLSKATILKFGLGGIVGNTRSPYTDLWYKFSESKPFESAGVVDGKKVMSYPSRFPGVDMTYGIFENYYGEGYQRKIANTMNLDLNLVQKLDFITKGLSVDIKGAYNTNYAFTRNVNASVETWTPFYKSEVDGSGLELSDPNFDKTMIYRITGQNKMNSYSEGGKSRGRNWYLEGSFRYHRKFGNHNVGALLLYNQSKKYYPSRFSDVATGYVGLAGRLTYDYKSRYMAEFNIGYNGSENFAPDKRFGTFPAGSVGYVITEEKFFPKNDFLTYLKIRASVGLVGNDNMSNNRFLYLPDTYVIDNSNTLNSLYKDVNGYIFGLTNTAYQKAAYESKLGNPNVTWETALKQNYGFDVYFFKDRLKMTFDYFLEKRKDILITRGTIPAFTAMGGILPVVNMGKVNNKGYEIDLKWNDKIRDFSYYINANVSYSRNKIIYMDEVEPNEPYMRLTGQQVGSGSRFGYVALGFYTKDDFNEDGTLKAELPQPLGAKVPGDIKYADLNNDNVIDSDDKTVVGNPKRPAYTLGLNYGIEYKGFFASMNWTGVAETDILMGNAYKQPFNGKWTLYQFRADGRWTPETASIAKYPRMALSNTDDNYDVSRVWMNDASYIRLKNLTIGYNISNKKLLNAIGASRLSVQFTGYNLLTFDKLDIFDPEGELTRDGNEYPIMKIFSLGVKLTF